MPRARNGAVEIDYDQRGSGPPLLLINGFTWSRVTWMEGVLKPLAEKYRLVLMDNRGVGRSDKPQGSYSLEDMADDCAAVLEHAGVRQAHVFGTSMGGMIAQRLAARHPERVRGLVLGCTHSGGPQTIMAEPRILALLGQVPNEQIDLREIAYRAEEAVFTSAFRAANRALLDCFFDLRQQHPTPLHAMMGQLQAIQAFTAAAHPLKIASATLVITGTEDVLIPPGNSRLIAGRVPGAKLVELPQAAHGFWIERPQAAVAAVLEFLATCS